MFGHAYLQSSDCCQPSGSNLKAIDGTVDKGLQNGSTGKKNYSVDLPSAHARKFGLSDISSSHILPVPASYFLPAVIVILVCVICEPAFTCPSSNPALWLSGGLGKMVPANLIFLSAVVNNGHHNTRSLGGQPS